MFSYSTGYYVSLPVEQYLKFKNRCSLFHIHVSVGDLYILRISAHIFPTVE